jgi:hypothetical protein
MESGTHPGIFRNWTGKCEPVGGWVGLYPQASTSRQGFPNCVNCRTDMGACLRALNGKWDPPGDIQELDRKM